MKTEILIIEDNVPMQSFLRSILEKKYNVVSAHSAQEAYQALKHHSFSVILLDIGLPDESGFQVCEKIQENSEYRKVPIIFLTAHSESDNKVKGFALGADDYLTKPFDPAELEARIEARLRKAQEKCQTESTVEKGPFRVALDIQKVTLLTDTGEIDVDLTSIEFKVFYFLFSQESRVITRQQLLERVWGKNVHVTERNIDTCIYTLRKKFGKLGDMIRSYPKVGYGLNLESERESASQS